MRETKWWRRWGLWRWRVACVLAHVQSGSGIGGASFVLAATLPAEHLVQQLHPHPALPIQCTAGDSARLPGVSAVHVPALGVCGRWRRAGATRRRLVGLPPARAGHLR